jgi:hypothetical protein
MMGPQSRYDPVPTTTGEGLDLSLAVEEHDVNPVNSLSPFGF